MSWNFDPKCQGKSWKRHGKSNCLPSRHPVIDMSALREASDREEITIQWIETRWNLANPLTKKSANSGPLLEALRNGRLTL